ncbi:hypothetical protein THF1C08_50105 [Vibrio jasicida]|uniref:DUF3311 domain-containing protein n=1 Tax=Vibrio jasicida TaxID=766224 RepID=A0AAU9QW24_9VIBR|nr:hypothetical protein THF1C08_50105 [Vibrio jasicida]CAH1601828.1 hypothetical protein THF1A12_50242 [Vibrio jasicida]
MIRVNDAVRKLVNPHFWIPIVVSTGMMVLVFYIVPLLGYAMLSAPQPYRFLAQVITNLWVQILVVFTWIVCLVLYVREEFNSPGQHEGH